MIVLSESTRHDLGRTHGPAALYFKASWCGPCTKMSPVVQQLSDSNPDIPFFAVDIDEFPELKERMMVKAVPMLLFINAGRPKGFAFGEHTLDALQKKLDIFKRTINA